MAVRSIRGSSGNGPTSVLQNPDRRDFPENTENIPLSSASNQLDLNIDQNIIDWTRDIDISEDGDYPATKLNYDRGANAHHIYTFITFEYAVSKKNSRKVRLILNK